MPDFLTIKRQHDAAKLKGLISADTSLADFAKLGALATNDPSYQEVANSPAWKNMIRSWSASADEAIQSGPVDDWTAEAFGWVGDKLGVTPEASRAAGRELPRQMLNFVPMAAGGAIGLATGGPPGAVVGGKIGLGITSGLSAFDAYGKSGKVSDAIIGGVAPYLGGKLSELGSKAALRSAATPGSMLNKLGFMQGKNVAAPATHTITDALTGTTKQVLGETVDTFKDKALGYVAGEALANVGFTGLDIVQQGPDAVLNRDYLFANLASNIPFMAADLPNFTKTRFAWEPEDAPLVPTQAQINAEKTSGERAREALQVIDDNLAKFQKELELGVDVGRFVDKHNGVASTMEGHRAAINQEALNFKSTWDKLREVNSALPDVLTGIDPKALLQNPSVIGFDPAKAEVLRYAEALKQINKVKSGNLQRLAKTDADLEKVMGLVEEDLKLPETLLNTPVEARTAAQYQQALGSKLSDNAIKLIRMKHLELAQGENFQPEFPKLWEEYQKALTGKFEGSIDDRYELITASLLANRKFPKVVKAQKKVVKKVKDEGLTEKEAAKEVTDALVVEDKADSLKKAVAERMAAAKAAEVPAVEKAKPGRKEGPTKATLDKNASMEERILLASKALNPTDEDRFFIIANKMIDPANRAKGLNWLSKVATEHAPLPLPQKLLKFQAGLKTIDERVELSSQLKTVPLNEEITADSVEEVVAAIGAEDEAIVSAREESMRELIVEETARELDEDAPEISQSVQEQNLARDFMVALAKKAGVTISPEDAARRFANMPLSVREKNLALAKQWKEKGFPQLAANDIDPLTIHFTTGQPLPIKEFATAWAKEVGVPENEIPAVVDDFVRITQYFAAGESRFGKLEGAIEGAQFARTFRPAVQLNGVVYEAPTHLQAWEKAFRKPFAAFGPAETAQMKDSVLKEGFVTEKGFANRKDALKEFQAKGGKMNLTPGEKRDWLDSSDIQFARASAGAFDFGMREVKNGQIQRPGKPPLGTKDGWMTELDFRNNGGDLGPLQKDEVAFYKQLVPEAFADGKVHLQKLWDGLNKVGEQVKVVTYGQEAKVNPEKLELDQLTHNFYDTLSVQDQIALANAASLDPAVTNPRYPENKENIERVTKLKEKFGDVVGVYIGLRKKQNQGEFQDNGPRATSYYNQISPFDTKKFPVVRVDVVLPSNLKGSAPVHKDIFGNEYQTLSGETKAPLWQQDDTHENLPNTLGWAMVQIVPDPKTGESVMFVGEAQSRWSQERRKNTPNSATPKQPFGWIVKFNDPQVPAMHLGGAIKTEEEALAYAQREHTDKKYPPHTILPIHQNLILKSVIKEAQKQGITKVAISDGETAMMTEGHDKTEHPVSHQYEIVGEPFKLSAAEYESLKNYSVQNHRPLYKLGDRIVTLSMNFRSEYFAQELKEKISFWRPPQEGGMRLAYDTTLPSIMSKLVGTPPGFEVYHGSAWGGHVKWQPHDMQHFGTEEQAANRIKRSLSFEPDIIEAWPEDHLGNLLEPKPKIEKVRIKGKFKRTEDVSDDYKWHRISQEAREEGYDGLVYKNEWEGAGDSYLVFDKKNVLPFFAQGQMEDFGVHKNALGDGSVAQSRIVFESENYRDALSFAENQNIPPSQITYRDNGKYTVLEKVPQGSPVFRNPDGTPKTNVTARVYDISSPSERVNTLFARGGTIYGAAFKNIAQAYFSTKAFQGAGKVKAMSYVLAHENAHIAFGKAMRGEYGPETKQLFDDAIGWVKTNDPQVLRDVEEVIRDLYLPKEFHELKGVKDVLGNSDGEEWLANAHAMMVTGAVNANKPIKALLILPKPIRNAVENTVRRIQEALKHARMYWKLSGDKDKMNQVLRVKSMMDSVRRQFREAEWQMAQAVKFLDINPASLLDKMQEAQFARSPYPVEGVRQRLGDIFNKGFQGLGGFMATYKDFVEPGWKLMNSGNVVSEQTVESLAPIFGHQGAAGNIVVDKSLPWYKIASSKPLENLTKRINLEAQDSSVSAIVTNPDGTLGFNWNILSPALRAELKLYNPERQKLVAQFLMQKEKSTRLTQKHNVEHETNKAKLFAVNLLTRMKSFDANSEPVLRHKEARVVAEGLFDALAAGDQASVQVLTKRFTDSKEAQKLVEIIQEKQKKLDELAKFYAARPNFQSLRRFKNIIQRYTDANGESKVLDFNSGSEAEAMKKELMSKGWKPVGLPILREIDKKLKTEFTVDSKVIDLLETKEGRLKELIDSMDIDPADREALLGESSFLADVLREAKSNDIYLPGVKRRISGGPEHLDMLEQHLIYTQAAHKVGYMTTLGEELKYHMNNPALKDQVREKAQFMDFYKQAKESDPKFWRMVNKANAVWHIGFNLPGHLAELFQPLQTHIHEAVYQGHSILTALKTTVGAEKSAARVIAKLIKSKVGYHDDAAIWENWPDKGEAEMLKVNWRRSLTQPLQEVYQQVGVNQETLRAIAQDREMPSVSKVLTKPLNMYSNAAMGLYSVFTQHNNLVGLLTGYRLAKKKGLSHEEAVKSAALFELTANNSGGRMERPVYFNKLGSAGYMVYALSSYVRGRFTDLARYYRHGFDKVNFPELDQKDRRAARQAFASMIAGQLAAAGILGFPFVGPGIALMEDLTGDEIKGNGLIALNEMTDDPLLTQALSYGVISSMAESLGIPADLHSRFALSGFMGLNAYDGISAASVLGPTASMVNSMWKMGKALVQEKDLNAAFKAGGPGGVKRMAEALSQEFQAENPDANLPLAMAGFRSGKMFKAKETERIVSKTNEAAQRDIKLAAKRVEESLLLGPEVAQKTLMREANLLIDQTLTGRGRQLALKNMMQNLRQRVALQKVKEQMPSDIRGEATAQTASRISQAAQAIGYQPPEARNVEQEQIMRYVYSQLGGQRSQSSLRRAQERQMELEQNPGMFY